MPLITRETHRLCQWCSTDCTTRSPASIRKSGTLAHYQTIRIPLSSKGNMELRTSGPSMGKSKSWYPPRLLAWHREYMGLSKSTKYSNIFKLDCQNLSDMSMWWEPRIWKKCSLTKSIETAEFASKTAEAESRDFLAWSLVKNVAGTLTASTPALESKGIDDWCLQTSHFR